MKNNNRRCWWQQRKWHNWLQDLLLTLSRRRYTLILSDSAPLGATSFTSHIVTVNPMEIVFPQDRRERKQIPNAPSTRNKWQQTITTALVQHEAGHIRFSGSKPHQPVLGWLWNALEDERIERLLVAAYPQMKASFQILNGAVWQQSEPTDKLLDGCLLWRWEYNRPQSTRKFQPATPKDLKIWEEEIQALVEKAWLAKTSDEVTQLGSEILQKLGISEDAQTGNNLIVSSWLGPDGERDDSPEQEATSNVVLPLAPVKGIPGYSPASPSRSYFSIAEATPEPWLALVEGYARDLAAALHPPVPNVRIRPHSSRGELNLT